MNTNTFKAMIVKENNGKYMREIGNKNIPDLPEGDVLINVKYSSLNYKDALSAIGNKGITKNYPHTPGIDAAGVVELSDNPLIKTGDQVVVTGYDLVRPVFGGANAGVEEQRFGRLSRGEQIVGADNIFNVLLNSGINSNQLIDEPIDTRSENVFSEYSFKV